MNSAREAVAYMKKIHTLVRYLEISDGNMQEGSFRCDANVSVRQTGSTELGTRAEIKNINSFKFVEQAINFEIERQIDILEDGGSVVQETRLYDPAADETRSMRSKEEANDYRYFPDPDLLPVEIDQELVSRIQNELPELPDAKCQRYINELGLSEYDSRNLSSAKSVADYFESCLEHADNEAKLCANWIMGELSAALNREQIEIEDSPLDSRRLGQLIIRIKDGTVSNKMAKQVFEELWNTSQSADEIIESKGLKQVTDSGAIEALVDEVIADSHAQVEQYRNSPVEKRGKLIGYFVGQIMKKSQGKANPQQVNQLLKEKLDT